MIVVFHHLRKKRKNVFVYLIIHSKKKKTHYGTQIKCMYRRKWRCEHVHWLIFSRQTTGRVNRTGKPSLEWKGSSTIWSTSCTLEQTAWSCCLTSSYQLGLCFGSNQLVRPSDNGVGVGGCQTIHAKELVWGIYWSQLFGFFSRLDYN